MLWHLMVLLIDRQNRMLVGGENGVTGEMLIRNLGGLAPSMRKRRKRKNNRSHGFMRSVINRRPYIMGDIGSARNRIEAFDKLAPVCR